MKVGDLVKLTFNDLIGVVISETDEYGWYKVMDVRGNQWECNGETLEVYNCEGG